MGRDICGVRGACNMAFYFRPRIEGAQALCWRRNGHFKWPRVIPEPRPLILTGPMSELEVKLSEHNVNFGQLQKQ